MKITDTPVTVDGLAELAKKLPDDEWYMLRVIFRKTKDGAEVRLDPNLKKVEIKDIH